MGPDSVVGCYRMGWSARAGYGGRFRPEYAHRSTACLDLPANPLIEDFRIAFQDALPAALDALEGDAPDDTRERNGWGQFQRLLLPERTALLDHLCRLKDLQTVMRSRPRRKVIFHTDLHGGNLMLDRGGNLHIIDWEGAMLAPLEQDLFSFAELDTFPSLFWPNYRREYPEASLDLDALRFYYYRRGLEDLSEWLQRLLYSSQTEEQVKHALHWAQATLEDLAKVELKLARIGRDLSGLR